MEDTDDHSNDKDDEKLIGVIPKEKILLVSFIKCVYHSFSKFYR